MASAISKACAFISSNNPRCREELRNMERTISARMPFGCTRIARIMLQQMAISVFRMGKQMPGQPAYQWSLANPASVCNSLIPCSTPTVLVFCQPPPVVSNCSRASVRRHICSYPTSVRKSHSNEPKTVKPKMGFVPRPEPCRYGRKQCNLYTQCRRLQLFFQRRISQFEKPEQNRPAPMPLWEWKSGEPIMQ